MAKTRRYTKQLTTGVANNFQNYLSHIMQENLSPSLYISTTAKQSGYGSERYKTVTFLTPDERANVRANKRVFFMAERISANGPKGTFWRVAKNCGKAIGPRVPTPEEVAQLRAMTKTV
jgi:hypothetical protein